MGFVVPISPNQADKVRDHEVDVEEGDEDAVPGEDWVANSEEPHTGRQ